MNAYTEAGMDDEDPQDQAPRYSKDDLDEIGQKWIEKIRASEKRDEIWLDDAEEAEAAYLCGATEDGDRYQQDFNILHANVETIVPAIFNSTPQPDIRPRHANRDEAGKLVADIYERALMVQIDDSRLDTEIEAEAQDGFMAGRGIVRVKFDTDIDQFGMQSNERIIYENVSWRDYREGPAKRWSDVPWVAFRHCVSQQSIDKIKDDEMWDLQRNPDDPSKSPDDLDIDIWEIWCKETSKVYIVMNDNCRVLNIQDDPLKLKGFFPMAQPVQPITPTGKRCPVCPFRAYRTLAEELDTTTRRINTIIDGLRVRGFIAGDAESLDLLSSAEDNTLVPVPNIESLVAMGGLSKAIMWWPIEIAVAVLRELYVTREQTKAAIYEITGISDIVRGAGQASETATAQNIKTQWGSLRIKKMQRMIERSIRDLFVISAEIISQNFTVPTLQKMTGIQIPPEAMHLFQKPLDHYRIDVESDSTVRADLTKNRTEMSEFLNGTANFFGAMAPLVAQEPRAAEPVSEIFGAFARQFNLGKSAEDALEKLVDMAKQAANQPRPDPEGEALKAEQQFKMQELQGKQQLEAARFKLDMQKGALDVKLKGAELQLKNRELGIKSDKVRLDEAVAETNAAAKMLEIEMEDEQQRAVKFGE